MGLKVHTQDLIDFCRCEQKAKYSLWKGYRPKETSPFMSAGALIHQGLMEGYRWLRDCKEHPGSERGAKSFIEASACAVGREEAAPEDKLLAADIISYYWQHVGQHEQMDEILRVEEPITVPFGAHEITMTMDLVYRQGKHLYVRDHKTTGQSVKEALATIDRDIQFNVYMLGARSFFGRDPILMVNLIRRAVPHELTKSGRKSTASKDPADYLRQQRIWKTPDELAVMEAEVLAVLRRMTISDEDQWWKRTPIKSGGEACVHCMYRDICGAEWQRGEDLTESEAGLLYKIERRDGSVAPGH